MIGNKKGNYSPGKSAVLTPKYAKNDQNVCSWRVKKRAFAWLDTFSFMPAVFETLEGLFNTKRQKVAEQLWANQLMIFSKQAFQELILSFYGLEIENLATPRDHKTNKLGPAPGASIQFYASDIESCF